MKRILKSIPVFFVLLFFSLSSFSQDISGIWRGNFFADGGSQYRIEVQLDLKGNTISGVTYSYHTTDFYGKATMTGNFNKPAQKVLFEEIKTVELRMSQFAVPCIMKYNLVYSRSGKEEFLEGTYSSIYEKDSFGGKKGQNCGDGRVYLRKVPNSDFYVEPFLRDKQKKITSSTTTADSLKPKTNPGPTTKPTTTQTPRNTVTVKPKTTAPKTTSNKNTSTNTKSSNTVAKIKKPIIDSSNKTIPKIAEGDKQPAKTPQVTVPKPAILKSRQNELVNTFTVNDENVVVKLYDNGEIDGDSISVYLDNKIMLSHKLLTASAIELKLKMDEENDVHELVMVAENLGRIPPNTSLMIVEAGDQRFTARITSTYQKNAMVRFKYVKK